MTKEKIKKIISDYDIKHIAFIMDGNGRWAKKRGFKREVGHKFGAEVTKKIIKYCSEVGIKNSTYYAFSTENWKRPKEEVDALMKLLNLYIDDMKANFLDSDVQIVFIGDLTIFEEELKTKMIELQELTSNKPTKAFIAVNYGGRSDIVNAVNKIIDNGEEVTEESITNNLYTYLAPMPEMIIRTGKEKRLSNFLTWQSVYSELFFINTLWPDFNSKKLDKIIKKFTKIHRRFGGV